MRKGTPKMEFNKNRMRGKLINGEWKEPWKSYNPNCAKCRYRNPEHVWASQGTCNYLGITGKTKNRTIQSQGLPGVSGQTDHKRKKRSTGYVKGSQRYE